MAWRDRMRRRGAVPNAAGAVATSTGATGAVQEAAAGRGPGVPADWDGGWRRTTPALLTVSRAPMSVSDGLAFRDGLAAWRDPSFDTGLAHALLPTAPTGLVRGIARPAVAHPTHSGGGPLLLRALRAPDADAAPDAGPWAGAGAPQPEAPPAAGAQATGRAQPGGSGARASGARASAKGAPLSAQAAPAVGAGTGTGRSSASPADERPGRSGGGPEAPSGAGATAGTPATLGRPPTQSAAVLGADALGPDADHVVQRAEAAAAAPAVAAVGAGRTPAPARLPLVRRITVVPGTSGEGAPEAATAARPVQRIATGAGPLPAAARRPGREAPAAGVRPGDLGEGAPADRAEATQTVVRTRPVGPSLTGARVPAAPRRRVPAVRPAVPPAPLGGPSPEAPVQRAADHAPPLGTPPTEVPAPAPSSDVAGPAPAPAMPVVQRQAETVLDRPGTSVRGADEAPVQRTADRPAAGASPSELPSPTVHLAQEAVTPAPAAPALRRQAETVADATVQRTAELPTLGEPAAELPTAPAPLGALPSPPTPGMPTVQHPTKTTTDTPMQRTADHPTPGTPPAELPTTPAPLGALPSPPTPGMPIVQHPTKTTTDTPVQRTAGRPTLGPPLIELPTTARPLGHGATVPARAGDTPSAATPPAPTLPVVQRQPEAPAAEGGPGRTARRPRAGLGAPLPAMPPTASPPAAPPTVRSRPVPVPAPVPGAGQHPASPPPSPAPTPPTTASPTSASPTSASPTTASPTSASRHGGRAGVPAPPAGARTSGPVPLVLAGRSGAPGRAPAAPHRSVQLLAARPLALGSGPDLGSATAPVMSARAASRPVVTARWAAPPSTAAPQHVQRAPGSPGPPPASASEPVRPSEPLRGPEALRTSGPGRSSGPLPVTALHAPPLVVRPSRATSSARPVPVVPLVRSRTPDPGGTSGDPPASPPLPVQRDSGSLRGTAPATTASGTAATTPRTTASRTTTSGTATTSADQRATASGRTDRTGGSPRDAGTQGGDLDVEDLARRLIDPVARLLRAELRRGRDRAGRTFDGLR